MERREREESCFSRAARSIRRALSRICRDSSPSPSDHDNTQPDDDTDDESHHLDYLDERDPEPMRYHESVSDTDDSDDHINCYELCKGISDTELVGPFLDVTVCGQTTQKPDDDTDDESHHLVCLDDRDPEPMRYHESVSDTDDLDDYINCYELCKGISDTELVGPFLDVTVCGQTTQKPDDDTDDESHHLVCLDDRDPEPMRYHESVSDTDDSDDYINCYELCKGISDTELVGPPFPRVKICRQTTKKPLPQSNTASMIGEDIYVPMCGLYDETCMGIASVSSEIKIVPDTDPELVDLHPEVKVRRKRVYAPPPPPTKRKREDRNKIFSFGSARTTDPPDSMLDEPPPGPNRSSAEDSVPGTSQDKSREMELHATASSLQPSTSDEDDSDYDAGYHRGIWIGGADRKTHKYRRANSPSTLSDPCFHLPSRTDTDDGRPSFTFSASTVSIPSCSQSRAPTVSGPPCPQSTPTVAQHSAVSTEGGRAEDAFEPGGDIDALVEVETPVTAVDHSATNTQPAHCLHQEFTPDITAEENDETYRFQTSCPGLYQCSVTGLVFHMQGEGDVLYRTVPWNRRLLAQQHMKPAGPLFDIKCVQQSVCQLHLPHCEIRSTGGWDFLSVAHVNDEDVEFLGPHKITETHVIINITGFSAFGNVKDVDSPPAPVRALVLLFYRPPADPEPTSLLNVLLLPRNVVLRDVLRTRKKLVGDESYIETSPHCKLLPKKEYSLSTCPEDDSVLVQPKKAEFDEESYDDYFPSFQVRLKKLLTEMKLLLRETCGSDTVWESEVSLPSTGVRRSSGRSALNLPPNERLLDIRSSFIDGISGPVLRSLLDKLLEKKVMADSERESADVMQNKGDKARFVIDTVRKKGEAASSEMIEFLCEADPFLCEHLGLI